MFLSLFLVSFLQGAAVGHTRPCFIPSFSDTAAAARRHSMNPLLDIERIDPRGKSHQDSPIFSGAGRAVVVSQDDNLLDESLLPGQTHTGRTPVEYGDRWRRTHAIGGIRQALPCTKESVVSKGSTNLKTAMRGDLDWMETQELPKPIQNYTIHLHEWIQQKWEERLPD